MNWIVSAPSRLHFGLIDLTGDHGRIDGGAGVALESPRVVVQARHGSGRLEMPDELIDRVRGLADSLRIDLSSLDLELLERFPAHVGLGSHTQMVLAFGTAMCRASGCERSPLEIARLAGRGGTSGIGVNVFSKGGLVIDGGHSFGPGLEKESCLPSSASNAGPAPLLARYHLPEEWRFALITPRTEQGAHGQHEVDLFQEAFPLPTSETGEVCRRVLMELMPGARAGDLELLGRCLTALQRVGFKKREVALQPAPVRSLIDLVVEAGAAGAGLSSFGPTIYALTTDQDHAETVIDAARAYLAARGIDADAWITKPDNHGAIVRETPRPTEDPARDVTAERP